MEVVREWTGARAAALQAAMRETNEGFAKLLDIAPRTVAAWRANPGMVPSLEMQQLLDVAFERAPESVRARFALLTRPAEPAAQVLRVAIAVVLRDDEVLLTLRNGDDGITWSFVGAIVKPGQRPEAVLMREVRDETGVLCSVDRLLGERVHPISNAACTYWQCSWLAGEASNLDQSENLDLAWVARDQVTRFIKPDMIYPPILALLEGATA